MKLIINKDRSVIPVGTWGTVNENDYEILEFEFPAELEEYNKRIVYYLGDERVWDTIVNNKAYITNAITTKGDVKAYVWCTKENTEREADTDFRTMLFEMHFFENENADGIAPTEVQVDGFNTMLTAMNAKIDEVDALETTIEAAEAERQEAETTRVSNENTRESNESTRQTNEQTRQSQEADRERRTDEAIADIEDKTAEYNANAEAKTTAFNQNATQKTEAFNNNATQKTDAFNSNAESKTSTFNTNATNKTNDFNTNASSKTTTFNENATSKTNTFNSNADDKTSAFNDNSTQKTTNFDNNASSKTSDFNTNAESKTNTFNDNASAKTTAFNENALEKTEDFDEHTEEMQQEIDELSANMPWNTTEQATEISVDDAAKYSRNKLELFGNTSQASTSIDGGDEYDSPSPDHPQPIHVVTGNNSIEVQGKNWFSSELETGDISYQTGNNTSSSNRIRTKDFIDVIPNKIYTLKRYTWTGKQLGLRLYDKNKNYLGYYSAKTTETITFTTNEYQTGEGIQSGEVYYIKFIDLENDLSAIYQLEEGSTASTDYVPYYHADYPINLGSLELCKIGDYQDYLYKENGNWYKYGAIGKLISNDYISMTWQQAQSSDEYSYFYSNSKDTTIKSGIFDGYCNLFNVLKSQMVVGTIVATDTINFGDSGYAKFRLKIKTNRLDTNTQAGLKTWFGSVNLISYIILNTPATTQITDETLIAQLDEIYEHLQLVKGTNNITVTAEDLAPYMQLSYMQDLPSKLDNLDSRLSLLE